MSKISLSKAFTMSLDEVREGLEKIGQGLKSEHGLNYSWVSENRVEFNHKAVKGYVEIQVDTIMLELKLGMLYSAMAPVVKKRIIEMADQHIK